MILSPCRAARRATSVSIFWLGLVLQPFDAVDRFESLTLLTSFLRRPCGAIFAMAARRSSSDSWAYHRSMVRIPANPDIACRYARTDAAVADLPSALVRPLFLAAMVKLAAMRFTSYSNGPGRVSDRK